MKYNNQIAYKPFVVADTRKYFIAGRCLSGSRHYSEYMTWNKALKEFSKYVAVVNYFGGGTVEIYSEDGELYKSKTVFSFDF